jgi:hypothetical protein
MSFRVNATFSGMHSGSSSLTPHKRVFAMPLRISRLIFDPSGPRILHGMSLCQGNIHECASRVCANTHVLMRINHVTSNMLSFQFSNSKWEHGQGGQRDCESKEIRHKKNKTVHKTKSSRDE